MSNKETGITVGGSYKIKNPYLVNCITPLHVGTGQSYESFVDLPIQRDSLGFPVIWGSSIKGALRNAYHNSGGKDDKEDYESMIFGPDTRRSEEIYASSLLILDASLLFIPVRSLYGLFAFCTHPYLLRQCVERLNLVDTGLASELNNLISTDGECRCSDSYIVKDGKAILREEEVGVKLDNRIRNIFSKFLADSIPFKEDILKRIVILNDDHADIIKRSTLVQTRIKVNYETKVVKEGALWTEEFLPEMSMLITLLLIRDGRASNNRLDASNIERKLREKLVGDGSGELDQFCLIIGGNETLGRGIVRFHKIKPSSQDRSR
ncbi:MAG: type III-B CRISPR module RAMP protein Cmr4 [Candidatus Micrarchaeota archaeon]|nr:type III-B CRISPR module RAMP protein Cmr4 [Candidatus Micrarchaeota archaeon]